MSGNGLNTKRIIENWCGNHLVIVGESFIVGILTGLAITAFRKSIDFISNLRIDFYTEVASGNALYLVVAAFYGLYYQKISDDKRKWRFANQGQVYEKARYVSVARIAFEVCGRRFEHKCGAFCRA